MDLPGLNLVDPRTYVETDMSALWRRLRTQRPVLWHPPVDGQRGFWVVSTYRHALAVYRDAERFSVERGNMLLTLLLGGDSAGGRMVSVTDRRRHKDLRTAILHAFSARALARVTEQIHQYTYR